MEPESGPARAPRRPSGGPISSRHITSASGQRRGVSGRRPPAPGPLRPGNWQATEFPKIRRRAIAEEADRTELPPPLTLSPPQPHTRAATAYGSALRPPFSRLGPQAVILLAQTSGRRSLCSAFRLPFSRLRPRTAVLPDWSSGHGTPRSALGRASPRSALRQSFSWLGNRLRLSLHGCRAAVPLARISSRSSPGSAHQPPSFWPGPPTAGPPAVVLPARPSG
ncbi:hypothetical protein HJG60_011481 [Phyllostomus discolor]|uniref:Uncharacterized protein n=1 Tax=Phyllostomus discolor TaxID=89673 RepID=A0A834E349_9CHIR|nr:hypothetical protein HJG60_011481 [Phyllostomus discolor]